MEMLNPFGPVTSAKTLYKQKTNKQTTNKIDRYINK